MRAQHTQMRSLVPKSEDSKYSKRRYLLRGSRSETRFLTQAVDLGSLDASDTCERIYTFETIAA